MSVIGIIYGALTAMMQKDMKKLVAYSSVSHLGFVMLGIFALNTAGIGGGILQMINHGLSTGALFLIVGLVYEQRHTRMISEYGGISKVMPIFSVFFTIAMLSSIGLPGLNGFIGEFAILLGAFQKFWNTPEFGTFGTVMVLGAASGVVLGAAYMLWLFQRVMFGPLTNPENEKLRDLNWREAWTLIPIMVLCFWIGLRPTTFTKYMDASVAHLVQQVDPTAYAMEQERKAALAMGMTHNYMDPEPGMGGEHGDGHDAAPAQDDHTPAAHHAAIESGVAGGE